MTRSDNAQPTTRAGGVQLLVRGPAPNRYRAAIATTLAHELHEALDELERQYLYGEISRAEWADRRNAHLAWFAERGIKDERGDEAPDAGDLT